MSEVANVYTDEYGRRFQYRLTENVYAPDEHGVLRLVERLPVPDDAYIADGELLLFAQSDGGYVDGTDLLTGDNPKFTLTEDPMHDNCAPCQAGLPEETHEAPDTMLKTAAKTVLFVLAVATVAAFMQWCG